MGKDKYEGDDETADRIDAPPPGRTESKKFGKCKKYEPSFHGPIQNRSCTDILCCILFIVFFIGMIVVGGIGWVQGDPLTLIYATDSMGNICGKSPGFENKPNLLYFDLLECFTDVSILELGCPSAKVCLEECPTITYAPYTLTLADTFPVDVPESVWNKFICLEGFNASEEYNKIGGNYHKDNDGLRRMFEDKKCAAYYIQSEPFSDRCIPAFLVSRNASAGDILSKGLSLIKTVGGDDLTNDTIVSKLLVAAENFLDLRSLFTVVFQDFVSSWHIILIGLTAGMILALLWIVVMRWIAGFMTWLSILALWAILGAGIYCCWQQYIFLEEVSSGSSTTSTGTGALSNSMVSVFISSLSGFLRLQKTWLAFGITLSILLLIIVLVTLCLCSRIRIAVQLIKEASKAVGSMTSTLFWPIVPFVLQVIIITLWATIAVFLATSHKATYVLYGANVSMMNVTECDPAKFAEENTDPGVSCMFHSYALPDYTIYLQFYNLFGLFWLMEFVVALGQVTLSGAFASYYWAYHKPQDVPALPLWGGFYRALRYHMGSIAFGSLIIAIIKIIRVLLEYAEVQLKKGKDNKVVSFILKCLKCCFYCLEKFLKFLNKNAYIMIAIYGKNFCSSAKDAFFLLMRNIIRVAVINKITDFLILLGILCITGGISVAAFFFFTNQITWVSSILDVPDVNYYWIVIIVIGLGVYVIAKCFFSVFDMAVDTIFLCFLEDLERHDGSAEKPYYMSKSMMKICGKKNKKPMTDNEDDDECEW